ncbi:MAG: hypothetical protein NWE92_12115 [Candidatus Bathyarchaeota archaeon]|nr:hypothetical protein [Candidatus Bathyarchaeota archaeon]
MQKIIAITIVIVIAVIVIGIAASLVYYNYIPGPSPTATPTATSTEPPTAEQVRDAAVTYIKNNHADAAQYLNNVSWEGGRATAEGLVGYETYVYTGGSWNVTIGYPVIPNPTYDINATYTAAGGPLIDWAGTYSDGTITETTYTNTAH